MNAGSLMSDNVVIVLVQTQLSHNIGASARAMANFGLRRLRLVAPLTKGPWYNKDAANMAAGADYILDGAEVFETLEDAIHDCTLVYATSNRRRDMVSPVLDNTSAAAEIVPFIRKNKSKVAIIFGREKSGLDNHHISLCDKVVEISVNKEFASLNLAQAVVVVAYELFKHSNALPGAMVHFPVEVAQKEQFLVLIKHLEEELTKSGFLAIPEKKELVLRKLRNIFTRLQLSTQEVQMFHGVIAALTGQGKFGKHRQKE